MTTIGTMRALDQTRGAVRVEEPYDTDIRDLWEACTMPERLARWLAQVSGDLQVGGIIEMTFTSTWSGPAKVEVCDPPRHLLLTTESGTEGEAQLEAWFIEEGSQTRLIVEERGLPLDELHFHGAGWQVHLEDLGCSLGSEGSVHPDGWSATQASPNWHRRWVELTPDYEAMAVEQLTIRSTSDASPVPVGVENRSGQLNWPPRTLRRCRREVLISADLRACMALLSSR